MMETLIVIPLYLVLIGGTMWIGDLLLARQRLLGADRYAAWNNGNRHRTIAPVKREIKEYFFPRSQTKDVRGRYEKVGRIYTERRSNSRGNRKKWWNEKTARVQLKINMPAWTQGWMEAGDELWGIRRRKKTDTRHKIYGRYVAGKFREKEADHLILMRTPFSDRDYFRNRDGNYLADPCRYGPRSDIWFKAVNEPWPYQKGSRRGVTDRRQEGMDYERFGQYQTWST